MNFTVFGITAIAIALTGIALDHLTAPELFAVIGIGGGLTGLLGMLSPRLRSL